MVVLVVAGSRMTRMIVVVVVGLARKRPVVVAAMTQRSRQQGRSVQQHGHEWEAVAIPRQLKA